MAGASQCSRVLEVMCSRVADLGRPKAHGLDHLLVENVVNVEFVIQVGSLRSRPSATPPGGLQVEASFDPGPGRLQLAGAPLALIWLAVAGRLRLRDHLFPP